MKNDGGKTQGSEKTGGGHLSPTQVNMVTLPATKRR